MASPSPAALPRPDEQLLHRLEPEQRLVCAVLRQALKDLEDRELPVRADAQDFLRGGGSFAVVCDLGHLDPGRVSRLASR